MSILQSVMNDQLYLGDKFFRDNWGWYDWLRLAPEKTWAPISSCADHPGLPTGITSCCWWPAWSVATSASSATPATPTGGPCCSTPSSCTSSTSACTTASIYTRAPAAPVQQNNEKDKVRCAWDRKGSEHIVTPGWKVICLCDSRDTADWNTPMFVLQDW